MHDNDVTTTSQRRLWNDGGRTGNYPKMAKCLKHFLSEPQNPEVFFHGPNTGNLYKSLRNLGLKPWFQHYLLLHFSREFHRTWRNSCGAQRWLQHSEAVAWGGCWVARYGDSHKLLENNENLVGGLEHFSFFHILGNIGNNHPKWLTFFRGVAQPPTRLDLSSDACFCSRWFKQAKWGPPRWPTGDLSTDGFFIEAMFFERPAFTLTIDGNPGRLSVVVKLLTPQLNVFFSNKCPQTISIILKLCLSLCLSLSILMGNWLVQLAGNWVISPFSTSFNWLYG